MGALGAAMPPGRDPHKDNHHVSDMYWGKQCNNQVGVRCVPFSFLRTDQDGQGTKADPVCDARLHEQRSQILITESVGKFSYYDSRTCKQ